MVKFVTCKICGKSLKQITNIHLKCHNITPNQYKTNFSRDLWKRFFTITQSYPSIYCDYHRFINNHVEKLTEERENEIEEEILLL